jgi:hypothetical protein|tara:strand:+ start:3605 stop:3805 length:201 start_codon:yes stop_codon:yes gene_type:complete
MANSSKNQNWIQDAIKRKGAFTKKAARAGMSVEQAANKWSKKNSKASTRTKKQANLAKTLRGFKRS